MFKNTRAFSSFSVDDIAKAKQFYSVTLGLNVEETEGMGLQLHIVGSSPVFIYPKPNHAPATFTVLNFMVDNIEEAVDELASKGVKMEHYDMPEIKTDEKGIVRGEPGQGPRAMAWFKDLSGNILAVMQEN